MQPLIVRRAGEFERIVFILSAWVGTFAVFTPYEISKALEAAWPVGNTYLFGVMALGGVGGFLAVRRAWSPMTPDQIRSELVAEGYGLAIVGLSWLGYSIAAFSLGVTALAAGSLSMGIPIACGWRIITIIRDLRRMRRALDHPCPAYPPPLGDPAGGED